MHAFFARVLAYPRTVLVLLLLPTIFFASALPQLKKETDAVKMLPADHPAVISSEQIEEEFGIKESMLVGIVEKNEDGIYHPNTLDFLYRVTEKLKNTESIDPGSVKGIFTVDDIVGTSEGFEVVPLLDQIPRSQEKVHQLRRRVAHNRMLQGELVSKDGTGTLVYADPVSEADEAALYYEILDFVNTENADSRRDVLIAGPPVVSGIMGVYVDQDLWRMFPVTGLVVVVMLALLLRSIRGVLIPLFVVIFSVIWTMGAMAVLGIPIHSITTAIPIIVMALGCADGIHILSRFYEAVSEDPKADKHHIILVTMDEMWRPVVMTSLTTTVGFLSLLVSEIEPLRSFGIFSAVGVQVAMLFSITFVPAILGLLKLPKSTPAAASGGSLLSRGGSPAGSRILKGFGQAVYAHRRFILVANLFLAALSLVSLRFLEVESDPMQYFDPDSEIPRANRIINDEFNGTGLLCVVLDAAEPDAFKSPQLLRKLEELQRALEDDLDDIGATISLADYLKLMNRAMHSDDPSWEVLPETREEIAQYLLLYSMSGDTEDLDRVVDYSFQKANLIVRLKTFSYTRVGRALEVVQARVEELFAREGIEFRSGGRAKLLHLLIDIIVRGEIYSILLSILGVFLITTLMFRSGISGVLNILPISAACLWNFGIMSLFRLPLDAGSAITSCIGIGVGIDYTIHFISKYRYRATHAAPADFPNKQSAEVYKGLTIQTMETAGKAITFNALVVIFGFLVLLLSNFPPTRIMGIMVSLNMFTCFFGALTLLPAALNKIRPRNCSVPWVDSSELEFLKAT